MSAKKIWNKNKLVILLFSVFVVMVSLSVLLFGGPFTNKGTQPPITQPFKVPSQCGCHQNYDAVNNLEPWDNWAGSPMAQSGRDPLFWASLDVANHDVANVGDFCIRCHSPVGWLNGRSEPPGGSTDGCGLIGNIDGADNDFEGLVCTFCHRYKINPTPPPGEDQVYYENGQFWIDDVNCPQGNEPCRRGPYNYPQDGTSEPVHEWLWSDYHEGSGLCGNCHNVTSPALNLIENGTDTGIKYPIERTYKEWQQSSFSVPGANFKTCQNCHMPDATVNPAYACQQKRIIILVICQYIDLSAAMHGFLMSCARSILHSTADPN